MDKKQLWLNLKAYHFDHLVPTHLLDYVRENFGGPNASTKAFASKIARKLKWSNKFALAAISEYKKFIYLGIVSDFAVTPSKIIDQVWHEHILFNKAYREFCTDVIKYNFDHNPELVPLDDQIGTYNAQYLETIRLYTREFGIEPPNSIWSAPKFTTEKNIPDLYESKRKKTNVTTIDNTPLFLYFGSDVTGSKSEVFSEFNDFNGGSGGGAGAGGSWSYSNDSSNDAGSDAGDSGSSCSSGCGSGD